MDTFVLDKDVFQQYLKTLSIIYNDNNIEKELFNLLDYTEEAIEDFYSGIGNAIEDLQEIQMVREIQKLKD